MRGFSFVLAPAAAGAVLELGVAVHWSGFCFFILWKVFAFAFVLAFRSPWCNGPDFGMALCVA
jgi:hypothetical protein